MRFVFSRHTTKDPSDIFCQRFSSVIFSVNDFHLLFMEATHARIPPTSGRSSPVLLQDEEHASSSVSPPKRSQGVFDAPRTDLLRATFGPNCVGLFLGLSGDNVIVDMSALVSFVAQHGDPSTPRPFSAGEFKAFLASRVLDKLVLPRRLELLRGRFDDDSLEEFIGGHDEAMVVGDETVYYRVMTHPTAEIDDARVLALRERWWDAARATRLRERPVSRRSDRATLKDGVGANATRKVGVAEEENRNDVSQKRFTPLMPAISSSNKGVAPVPEEVLLRTAEGAPAPRSQQDERGPLQETVHVDDVDPVLDAPLRPKYTPSSSDVIHPPPTAHLLLSPSPPALPITPDSSTPGTGLNYRIRGITALDVRDFDDSRIGQMLRANGLRFPDSLRTMFELEYLWLCCSSEHVIRLRFPKPYAGPHAWRNLTDSRSLDDEDIANCWVMIGEVSQSSFKNVQCRIFVCCDPNSERFGELRATQFGGADVVVFSRHAPRRRGMRRPPIHPRAREDVILEERIGTWRTNFQDPRRDEKTGAAGGRADLDGHTADGVLRSARISKDRQDSSTPAWSRHETRERATPRHRQQELAGKSDAASSPPQTGRGVSLLNARGASSSSNIEDIDGNIEDIDGAMGENALFLMFEALEVRPHAEVADHPWVVEWVRAR